MSMFTRTVEKHDWVMHAGMSGWWRDDVPEEQTGTGTRSPSAER